MKKKRTIVMLSVVSLALVAALSLAVVANAEGLQRIEGNAGIEITAPTYTITYYPNGGSGVRITIPDIPLGNTVLRQNSFTREGYIFTGWNTQAANNGVAYAGGATIAFTIKSQDLELYAQWRARDVTDNSSSSGNSGGRDRTSDGTGGSRDRGRDSAADVAADVAAGVAADAGDGTITIAPTNVPGDLITILDPEVPLANLPVLPGTGGNSVIIMIAVFLIAVGGAMLLLAAQGFRQRILKEVVDR